MAKNVILTLQNLNAISIRPSSVGQETLALLTPVQKLIFASIVCLFGICGCEDAEPSPAPAMLRTTASQTPYRVVTTTGMVTDLLREVAGPRAEITPLMGPGVDPHLYKPTRGDVKRLLEADVVVYSGLFLEGRMIDTFAQLSRKGKLVFAVTDGLDRQRLRTPPGFQGHYDPHVWMDVSLWSECVAYAAQQLAEFDPLHADEYHHRAATYQSRLRDLDAYIRRVIDSIPAEHRVLVTAHDAFGYFGRAYGLEVHSIQGVSTESEAGVQDIVRLVDFLVARRLPALFVETSVNSKNVQAVVEGCAARGVQVRVGESLFSDAMGPEGDYTGTYIGMMDTNASRIARALGGVVPPGGFRGPTAE